MYPGERPQGVRVPDSQLRSGNTGKPNSVSYAIPLVPYAVQYFDENGQQHTAIAYKMGNDVYFDLNSERWAAGLRQASKYIADAVNKEHESLNSPALPKDVVDVIASEVGNGQDSSASK